MTKYLLVVFSLFLSNTHFAQNSDHSKWNDLLQSNVSIEGNVDYKNFKAHEEKLDDYLELLSNNSTDESASKNETLAYWINAYNAFTIKLIIDNYPLQSIKEIGQPWDKNFIQINNKDMSLNDIEHKILRKMKEPRIHFAINCASVSCPKLLNQAFTAANLEVQLDKVSKNFINSGENSLASNKIEISKIFKWFGEDFKQNGTLIDFLNKYSNTKISKKAKIKFKDYNWNLNE